MCDSEARDSGAIQSQFESRFESRFERRFECRFECCRSNSRFMKRSCYEAMPKA